MDRVASEVSQTFLRVSSDIPATTYRDVVKRCQSSWNSTYSKFQRDMESINSELVPDLKTIMMIQESMVMISEIALRQPFNTLSRLNSILFLEKQNREITCRINALIKDIPEWSSAPQAVYDNISLCATMLERQKMDLALICLVSEEVSPSDRNPDPKRPSRLAIQTRQCLSKRLDAWKQKIATADEADCQATDANDRSSTQSSSGVMTALEGWSDVDSDTTERMYENISPIKLSEFNNISKCIRDFASFLDLLKTCESNKFNDFGARNWECAEMTECIQGRYSQFVNDMDQLLRVKQQGPLLEQIPPPEGSPRVSQVIYQAANSHNVSDCHEDRALEVIFSGIGSEITDEDVEKLARHWKG